MELKSPKAKKKSSKARVASWTKMFRTPLLIMFLLGTSSCDTDYENVENVGKQIFVPKDNSNSSFELQKDFPNMEHSFSFNYSNLNSNSEYHKHRHNRFLNEKDVSLKSENIASDKNVLSEVKYLRRRLNKQAVNFIMTDVLQDGEVENRVHFNGITAKETYVGANGSGIRLRQLTDGSHLVQVIYSQNGDIQDCEYIPHGKTTRNFLKTLRKELKLALDEQIYKLTERETSSNEEEKFFRHFGNVTFRILKNNELPVDVAEWLDYDKLKSECIERHEQLKYMIEHKNRVGESTLTRSQRSIRENFIVPGTKWCGAGQLAEEYHELGSDFKEDRCCRAHDNCRVNIGAFKRRFGYFNFRPFTVSHCRCDRRFRACLKLADTSVSNMVGKLFFNIVQTQCFVLKPVKICTQRSWWGKCLRRGYRKQAFLRDNLPY